MENNVQTMKIDFNDTMLGRGKPSQYKNGFYKGIITHVEQGTAKNTKNLYLSLTIEAVDASGTPNNVPIKKFVSLPIPNPNEAGHKPFKDNDQRSGMYKQARELIRTFEGSDFLPAFPVWDKETKQQFYPGTRDPMPSTEARALSDEIDSKTLKQLLVYWNEVADGASSLVDKEVFFGTKLNDAGWANVRYIRADAGEQEVITSNFTE